MSLKVGVASLVTFVVAWTVVLVGSVFQILGRAATRAVLNGSTPWTWPLAGLGLVALLLEPIQSWARALDHERRRKLARKATDVLSVDQRPPVLLLRSFADDGRHGDGEGNEPLDGLLTFEELIVEPLTGVGPVVAIGRPGEALPTAGAAREYVSHASWQNGWRP